MLIVVGLLALAGCQATTVEFKRGEVTQIAKPIAGPTSDWTVEFAEPSRGVAVERFRFSDGTTAMRQVLRSVGDSNGWIGGEPRDMIASMLEAPFFTAAGFSLRGGTVQSHRDGLLYQETRANVSCAIFATRVGGQGDGDLLRVFRCGPAGDAGAMRSRVEAAAARFYGI